MLVFDKHNIKKGDRRGKSTPELGYIYIKIILIKFIIKEFCIITNQWYQL